MILDWEENVGENNLRFELRPFQKAARLGPPPNQKPRSRRRGASLGIRYEVVGA